MNIEVFQRSSTDWIIVTGIREVPPSPTNSLRGFRHGYEAHWSVYETWSSTTMAMSFPTIEAAKQYLIANRPWMEVG